MYSELDLLRQENAKLMSENVVLMTKIVELEQINSITNEISVTSQDIIDDDTPSINSDICQESNLLIFTESTSPEEKERITEITDHRSNHNSNLVYLFQNAIRARNEEILAWYYYSDNFENKFAMSWEL
ncbi:hypothetical protein Glove_196g12 [Diversispora epigaea]|uniref:Uncharacterized protein n=1 Tax=Diversispora epigaea TaxID=1348612 RepID=A0A397IQJ6_9GLOM|nr:hypothetical protein Glove_196g12 [Diversispora epigaea]